MLRMVAHQMQIQNIGKTCQRRTLPQTRSGLSVERASAGHGEREVEDDGFYT